MHLFSAAENNTHRLVQSHKTIIYAIQIEKIFKLKKLKLQNNKLTLAIPKKKNGSKFVW